MLKQKNKLILVIPKRNQVFHHYDMHLKYIRLSKKKHLGKNLFGKWELKNLI